MAITRTAELIRAHDEIERLRDENRELKEAVANQRATIRRLQHEIMSLARDHMKAA